MSKLIINLIFLLFILQTTVMSISFELMSLPDGGIVNKRCFTFYLSKDIFVTGQFSTTNGQYQVIHAEITDGQGNILFQKVNAIGGQEYKFSFTTHEFADYKICFENILQYGISPNPSYFRVITFDTKTGLEAQHQDAIVADTQAKLKPIEYELNYLFDAMKQIVTEMEYLKSREIKMRDTNESTNERVKWFGLVNLIILSISGVGQIFYLRNFFQTKKLM